MKIFLSLFVSVFIFSIAQAQTSGCTDVKANNFNSSATVNNGSCLYDATTATTSSSINLSPSSTLTGISGSIYWKDTLWAHVDLDRNFIYAIDTSNGSILRTITISGATNLDWEDMAQDDNYIYIGDFGNNSKGNRTNLKIYKISKADVSSSNTVSAQVINFTYSDQTDFTAKGQNTTDFDCESMLIKNGKIYLFTKQWTSYGTSIYEIPSTAEGTYSANKLTTISNVGLLTGASLQFGKGVIALVGYRVIPNPISVFPFTFNRYLYLLYDYTGTDFFGGNVRLINLSGSLKSEAVCFINDNFIHIGSEGTDIPYFSAKSPTKESLSLYEYLSAYNNSGSLPIQSVELNAKAKGDNVIVNWVIMADELLKTIELQRKSLITDNYQTIQNFTALKSSFIDNSALEKYNGLYYRLKLSDKDNKPTYSKEVYVSKSTSNNVSFNLNKSVLTINIKGNSRGTIQIWQTDGKMYYQTALNQSSNSIYLNNLKSGINIAMVKVDGVNYSYKFLIN
ncbi:MAG: T9SS type A sorting domain-containing protein [Chitinophagaceae bacterium]|nr:T9SS type A sorting domain-containing protein [Chitinophagaceae bacterium]